MASTEDLIDRLLASSPEVRYVAVVRSGILVSRSKPDLARASAEESDAFEERIVNPTLLTLLARRGDVDCGGLRFVVIRYGQFFQVVAPIPDGHVSVALELSVKLPAAVRGVVERVESFAPVARGSGTGVKSS